MTPATLFVAHSIDYVGVQASLRGQQKGWAAKHAGRGNNSTFVVQRKGWISVVQQKGWISVNLMRRWSPLIEHGPTNDSSYPF